MGIWLCRTSMKAADGSEVWLLDSEGFFGPGVSESYDAKVFTIASLLGAHLVYNTVKIIDQQAVNLLEMLARRAQLFRTKSSAEQSGVDTPEFLSVRNFPPLTWVVEDFIQELPEQHRHADGATTWLRSYLSKLNSTDGGLGEDERFLSRLYSDLKVHTLFLPATSREHLQDLSKLDWEQLTPEFRDELSILRQHILHRLTARTFEGRAMTGQTLERALRFMVQALQRGMFHELPSLWATWTQQVAEMSLQDAESWFSNLIEAVDKEDTPIRLSLFNAQVEEARSKAEKFYGDLLHDFFVQPDKKELHGRMALKLEHKLALYHGRIHHWVSGLLQAAKDRMATMLSALELPLDPDTLRKRCENETRSSKEHFAQTLALFSEQGPPSRFPFAARMPPFVQDPQQQLEKDLRSIQGMREHENEQKILQVFKMAVDAASVAVEQEIAANNNRLLGKAKLKELQALVAASCWQAFDRSLAQRRWMMHLSHYKTHRALVQTDTYDRRLAKLAADNDQRVRAHFNSVLERCKNHYKAQKASLAMPVAEEDLDRDHRALGDKIRDMLEEQSRDLSDTDQFRGAFRSLTAVLEEGHQHVRQKNIDRWKVDSDEATRCAIRENRAVQHKCGMLCLFNKVPRVHKHTSQKHLLDCLARSGAGSRMPAKLQMQVFESWYAKDLGYDAAAVTNNFYIGSAVIGFAVLMGCVKWQGSSHPPPPVYYSSPNSYGFGNYHKRL